MYEWLKRRVVKDDAYYVRYFDRFHYLELQIMKHWVLIRKFFDGKELSSYTKFAAASEHLNCNAAQECRSLTQAQYDEKAAAIFDDPEVIEKFIEFTSEKDSSMATLRKEWWGF